MTVPVRFEAAKYRKISVTYVCKEEVRTLRSVYLCSYYYKRPYIKTASLQTVLNDPVQRHHVIIMPMQVKPRKYNIKMLALHHLNFPSSSSS